MTVPDKLPDLNHLTVLHVEQMQLAVVAGVAVPEHIEVTYQSADGLPIRMVHVVNGREPSGGKSSICTWARWASNGAWQAASNAARYTPAVPEGSQRVETGVRLAETIAPLSLATDLDMGQPLEHALRACLLALRLGRACGLSEEELIDIYYLSLVRYVGCTANQHVDAAVLGDDLAGRRWVLAVDFGDQAQFLGKLREHVGTEEHFTQALADLERTLGGTLAAHCEAASASAHRLGLSSVVQTALTQVYERWDGKGAPRGLAGVAIVRPLRVVQMAHQIQAYHRELGVEGAVAMARQRAGGWYDPAIVERFCANAPELLDGQAESDDSWEAVLAAEPGPQPVVAGEDLDRCPEAMADFADLQSPQFSGHSRGVAELAHAAAVCYGLPVAEANRIISRLDDQKHVFYLDIGAKFLDGNGVFLPDTFRADNLHPQAKGYDIWGAAVKDKLAELMK